MVAYEVFYSTPGKSGCRMIVLVDKEEWGLRSSVAAKDPDFDNRKGGERWSKIDRQKEVPLSSVKISDLSVMELLLLLKEELK